MVFHAPPGLDAATFRQVQARVRQPKILGVVQVNFRHGGLKWLALEFARLEAA